MEAEREEMKVIEEEKKEIEKQKREIEKEKGETTNKLATKTSGNTFERMSSSPESMLPSTEKKELKDLELNRRI